MSRSRCQRDVPFGPTRRSPAWRWDRGAAHECLRRLGGLVLVVLVLAAAGCEIGPRSGRGFRLPDGDAARGETLFRGYGCVDCHTIAGEDALAVRRPEASSDVVVVLGGEVSHIETYGELVTSIVNPSHGLTRRNPKAEVSEHGRSKMNDYNDTMTITDLIDLTAYVQSKYELRRGTLYLD
ncbi:MAG: c-type cytochrome [Myxococcota bacterium]